MIGRIEVFFRRLRRFFSRSEWIVRILGLPPFEVGGTHQGLILAQIDGLSHSEFQKALASGEMPFLKRLLGREHYALHKLYSGLPACTPASQAELFYGVKSAVPAFSFFQRGDRRLMRMYNPECANDVEKALSERGGEPLLKGGSAYSDIFTGGAAEPHFCAASSGWGQIGKNIQPLTWLLLGILHPEIVVRIAVLLVIELGLSIVDAVRGVSRGELLRQELKFIASRVGICILMRELTTVGALMDIVRGVPIVHLNFIGYDEQAHRRGPSSRFAHWALKGIDRCLRRIWRAAHRSRWRSYDLWVYADHGQETSSPHETKHGRPLGQDIERALKETLPNMDVQNSFDDDFSRARLLGSRRLQRFFPVHSEFDTARPNGAAVLIAHMGPFGHVYWPAVLAPKDRDRIAQSLVERVEVPMVLSKSEPGHALAWTRSGRFKLPSDAAAVLGKDHPFLEEAAHDLIAICHHPDAGTFVISGWCDGAPVRNFATENGSHGSPSPRELGAFALLPVDAPLPAQKNGFIRALDLRSAALAYLGRGPKQTRRAPRRPASKTFRLMTYNVHGCLGMDGKYSPERIARVIARHEPDVVALQELDVRRARSGNVDQASLIAAEVGMLSHFHPAIRLAEEEYGDALLSPHALKLIKADHLPRDPFHRDRERRGAIWAEIELDGQPVQVINTHLGLFALERENQIKALLGPNWLGAPACQPNVVLCGDFNIHPRSAAYRLIAASLADCQILKGHKPHGTWFTRYPVTRIDYAFHGPSIEVTSVHVPHSELERVASDHLPLIADLKIRI